MKPGSRPLDSGRKDALGRRVMVSGADVGVRADAPPPPERAIGVLNDGWNIPPEAIDAWWEKVDTDQAGGVYVRSYDESFADEQTSLYFYEPDTERVLGGVHGLIADPEPSWGLSEQDAESTIGYKVTVVVDADARGRGVAAQLMSGIESALADDADGWEAHNGEAPVSATLIAEVHFSNTASKRLVESAGFDLAGTDRDGFYIFRKIVPLDS